jgi:hypothetical protein
MGLLVVVVVLMSGMLQRLRSSEAAAHAETEIQQEPNDAG